MQISKKKFQVILKFNLVQKNCHFERNIINKTKAMRSSFSSVGFFSVRSRNQNHQFSFFLVRSDNQTYRLGLVFGLKKTKNVINLVTDYS